MARQKDRYSSIQNQIINFINSFGLKNGFEKLLAFLRYENPKENNEAYKFPIILIEYIINIMTPVVPLMTSSFKEKFFSDFKNVNIIISLFFLRNNIFLKSFFQRIENISNKELKHLDSQVVLKMIRVSQPLLEEFFNSESFNLTEIIELNFTLRLLKSQFLEKKIKAINEFKDFIDRVDYNIDIKLLPDKKRMRSFNFEKLRIFFLNNGIFKILLGKYFNFF